MQLFTKLSVKVVFFMNYTVLISRKLFIFHKNGKKQIFFTKAHALLANYTSKNKGNISIISHV